MCLAHMKSLISMRFLSTSQLLLFQLIEFNPRWELLLVFPRSYCLLGNSRNNFDVLLFIKWNFYCSRVIEEPLLCLALCWTSFEIPIRKATSFLSIASIDQAACSYTADEPVSMTVNSHTFFLTPKFILYSYESVTVLLKGPLIHTHFFPSRHDPWGRLHHPGNSIGLNGSENGQTGVWGLTETS